MTYPQIAGNFYVEQAPICRGFHAIRSRNIPIWKWQLMAGEAALLSVMQRPESRMAQKYRIQTLGLNARGLYSAQSWKHDENPLFFLSLTEQGERVSALTTQQPLSEQNAAITSHNTPSFSPPAHQTLWSLALKSLSFQLPEHGI